MFPTLFLLSVILVGNWIAAADINPASTLTSPKLVALRKVIGGTTKWPVLDISEMQFTDIENHAFDNFTHLKDLNLANNRISRLREFLFTGLVDLEYLNLANNDLTSMKYAFSGLGSLKLLNLSGNPLTSVLDDNCFFGLTSSCDISIKGNAGIKKISSHAFGIKTFSTYDTTYKDDDARPKSEHSESTSLNRDTEEISHHLQYSALLVCVLNNIVQEVKLADKLDASAERHYCKPVLPNANILNLNKKGITGFEKGWYRIKIDNRRPWPLDIIHLSNNKIVEVTQNFMSDIPESFRHVYLDGNKIKHLTKKTFVHPTITSLTLKNNSIETIQSNTFEMPKLKRLSLDGNQLNNTRFTKTLPLGLHFLNLMNNEITVVSVRSFSHLRSLKYLNLAYNRLVRIPSYAFHGPIELDILGLWNNKIRIVEANSFENVQALDLHSNSLKRLKDDVFNGLNSRIIRIDLSDNNLTKIGRNSFYLPNLKVLGLRKNNIMEIEKGAMRKLKRLETLDISENPLKRLHNGALFGLHRAQNIYIKVEKTPIEIIQGGVFDDV